MLPVFIIACFNLKGSLKQQCNL